MKIHLLLRSANLRAKHDPVSALRAITEKPAPQDAAPSSQRVPLPEPTIELRALANPPAHFERGGKKFINGVRVKYDGPRGGHTKAAITAKKAELERRWAAEVAARSQLPLNTTQPAVSSELRKLSADFIGELAGRSLRPPA